MRRLAIALVLVGTTVAHADPDKPGLKDYPLIQRFPHSHLSGGDERAWDRFEFHTPDGKTQPIDGHYIVLQYDNDKGAEKASALEYTRNYENALRSAGWSIDYQRPDSLDAHLEKAGRRVFVHIEYGQGYGNSRWVILEEKPLPMVIKPGTPTPPQPGVKPDVAGKDYPGVPRIPGQRIEAYDEHKFDFADFSLADGTSHRVEGHKIVIRYGAVPKEMMPAPSARQETENYRVVLPAEGWTLTRVVPGTVTATLRDHDKETWLRIEYTTGWGSGIVTIVEKGEMKQVVSASSLLERLHREGHIAFEVHFDTNQAEVKPESKPAIAQMLDVLKAEPALKVEIQGHTDSVGNDADNLALSDRRAKAVVALLVAGGIDAARLTAKGYGMRKPVADNGTEGGRALNRRVEMVRR